MLSVRQVMALVWAVRLGTLSRAAHRLNIAQPTISKRLQELELECGFEVFRKSGRSVELTDRGQELYQLAEQILSLIDRVGEIRSGDAMAKRRVDVGVTELTAHTWLPRLLAHVEETHARLEVHVLVEHGSSLLRRLQRGELDIVISPAVPSSIELMQRHVTDVDFALMASPRICDADTIYDGERLSRLPFITHSLFSNTHGALDRWMSDVGAKPERVLEVDSIAAQVGMAIAGLGATLLPRRLFRGLLTSGKLVEVLAVEPSPMLAYGVAYRRHDEDALIGRLAREIAPLCDFTISNQL